MSEARCQTALLGGAVEVRISDISLPCCEIKKVDEYTAVWPCGSLLVANRTGRQLTLRVVKVKKGDPSRQALPGTERIVQVPPKGTAEVAWYREPLQDEEYVLSVAQVTTEARGYILMWALVSAAVTGVTVAIVMSLYEKGKQRATEKLAGAAAARQPS